MKQIYNEIEYEISENSFKDYTGLPFVDIKDGEVIYASNFSQEIPDSVIFTKELTGCTFIKCNLMNVCVPEGNEVIDCHTTRFSIQNDLNDWIINEDDEPVKPIDYKVFEKKKLEVPDPEDIPNEKVEERINLLAIAEPI